MPSYSVANGGLSVALLQGNIAQDEKFQMGTGVADALQWYGEQLRVQPAALVVAVFLVINVIFMKMMVNIKV